MDSYTEAIAGPKGYESEVFVIQCVSDRFFSYMREIICCTHFLHVPQIVLKNYFVKLCASLFVENVEIFSEVVCI